MNVKLQWKSYGAAVLGMLWALRLLAVPVQAAPAVSAQCAVVYDTLSGEFLYEKAPDQRSLIASTTKIMTGYLVAELCDPDQLVTIPAGACGIEGSSLYLKPGEMLTVLDLLYGLMLHSGNDAAVALALTAKGSEAAFVQAMNERAARLGLTNTHFANPHGLDDDGNYSTARDLARLAAAALENELFAQVVATTTIQIPGRSLHNHNKLLWRYDGADGVKTGFTKAAGRILVSSATRGGRRLVAVTLNAPDDWQDHAALLDEGFAGYQLCTVLRAGEPFAALPLAQGAGAYAVIAPDREVQVLLAPGERITCRLLAPRFLYGPAPTGQQAAEIRVCLHGKAVASCAGVVVRTEA